MFAVKVSEFWRLRSTLYRPCRALATFEKGNQSIENYWT
jgi:hypothetical protein